MNAKAIARRAPAKRRFTLPLELRLALRDLRLGWSGFIVFVACIALGVAAIAGIGSLSRALEEGLARQGQSILGGDISLALVHRQANEEQRAYMAGLGTVSEVATLRAMARPAKGKRAALVRLKAVDARYPLYGRVSLMAQGARQPISSLRAAGVVAVEHLLLRRLDLKVGDALKIGGAELKIAAELTYEPDRLGGRPAFGPRVLMSLENLQLTGLVQPGSLVNWTYRIALDGDVVARAEGLKGLSKQIEDRFPDAGFTIHDRRNPSPNVRRVANHLSQFLTLVGITTLMI
ncbi:MAG TPA: ABC transporter permease, partial [Rhizobiales bacterium]|nr:ABC transporter permease [Hyphomicrobiales bacterium]